MIGGIKKPVDFYNLNLRKYFCKDQLSFYPFLAILVHVAMQVQEMKLDFPPLPTPLISVTFAAIYCCIY